MNAGIELRRLGTFAALALFVALGWVGMISGPPLARAALAALPVIAAAALLVPLRRSRLSGRSATAIAAALLLGATIAGVVIIGLPARLLIPGNWAELLDTVRLGLAGIGEGVSYPYDGPSDSSRLVMLAAAPLIVGVASLFTFLPVRRDPAEARLAGLGILVGAYGMAATIYGPGQPALRGSVLLLAVVAWLWLPAIRRRGAVGALALVALAVAVAVPFTARFQDGEGLVDYKSWKWAAGAGTAFQWDHSYGPIDWERTGETVMIVESEKPNYWKLSVLDRFDGRAWKRSGTVRPSLELPIDVEPDVLTADRTLEWETEASVSIDELRSDLAPWPGTNRSVISGVIAGPSSDRSILRTAETLSQGDAYEVRGYAPDPSARQMRAAGWQVPASLAQLTEIGVFESPGAPLSRVTTIGIRDGGAPQARELIDRSSYARVARLSDRLSAEAPTAYDAVKSIERHLLKEYEYSEDPPERVLPLESFLFEDRIGYCQQFSGAMALMLRMQGIPARVATGFSPGVPAGNDRFRVRDLDAHSWVEVYFGTIGWVPFDPTPPASPAELRTGGASATSSAASNLTPLLSGIEGFGGGDSTSGEGGGPDRSLDSAGSAPVADSSSSPVPALLAFSGALLAATALLLGPGLWRRTRERRLSPEAAAEARVRELHRALDRLGLHGARDLTLLDLQRALRSRTEPLAATYVEHLRHLRYERHPGTALPSAGERRALRRRLISRNGTLGDRITAYRAIPPFSPRL